MIDFRFFSSHLPADFPDDLEWFYDETIFGDQYSELEWIWLLLLIAFIAVGIVIAMMMYKFWRLRRLQAPFKGFLYKKRNINLGDRS